MELLTYTFGYPPIEEYPMLQVSGNRDKRDEVPGEIIDQLTEMNRDEIDLYEYGLKIFEKRLDEMRVNKKREIPSTMSAPRRASLKMDFRRVYPGQGWHVGEINSEFGIIRWSGPELVSYLRIPALVEQEYKISFRVVHALDPEVLAGLTLEMNGYGIALTRRDGDAPNMAFFDGDISQTFLDQYGNNNILAFKVQKTIRPCDVQINNPDTRPLGLCYNWLRIDPITK
jgi:hypothetical protein